MPEKIILHYNYLCSQARKAIFGMKHNLKPLGTLPPKVLFHMFDALIRPILLYGSDVWGVQTQGGVNIDKVFFWCMRCVLHVKSTTSNIIVVGECGQIPPSVSAYIKAICYLNRLQNLTPNMVKQTYSELSRLHNCGFSTWVTKVFALAQKYDIDLNMNRGFKF